MAGWTVHEGAAVALPLESVDTDQLIPARFMSVSRAEGYGPYLLHDLRFGPDGAAVADFPLNRHPGASVLVTRRNFGSGSSREGAVYALVDFGIRAVIAPSFGDIFAGNAVNNGLLPARIPDTAVEAMLARLADADAEARIDLTAGTLRVAGIEARFDLPESWKVKLINGWDDIDLTLQHRDRIAAFARSYQDDPAHRPEN